MLRVEFTDKQLKEKASEIFQDRVHNEDLLDKLARGMIDVATFNSRIAYLLYGIEEDAETELQSEADAMFDSHWDIA